MTLSNSEGEADNGGEGVGLMTHGSNSIIPYHNELTPDDEEWLPPKLEVCIPCEHWLNRGCGCLNQECFKHYHVKCCCGLPPLPLQAFICACLVVTTLFFVIIDIATTGYFITALGAVLDWLVDLEIVALIITYFLITTCGMALGAPTLLFTCSGGYIFVKKSDWAAGFPVFMLVAFSGCVAGTVIGFHCGRFCFKSWAEHAFKDYPRLAKLNTAIKHNGLKINFLLRLSYMTPDGVLTYGLCMTATKTDDLARGMVGILPWLVLNGYIGGELSSISDLKDNLSHTNGVDYLVYLFGLVATIVVIIFTYRYTQKALDKAAHAYDGLDDSAMSLSRPTSGQPTCSGEGVEGADVSLLNNSTEYGTGGPMY